jgi:hypothetical protein
VVAHHDLGTSAREDELDRDVPGERYASLLHATRLVPRLRVARREAGHRAAPGDGRQHQGEDRAQLEKGVATAHGGRSAGRRNAPMERWDSVAG